LNFDKGKKFAQRGKSGGTRTFQVRDFKKQEMKNEEKKVGRLKSEDRSRKPGAKGRRHAAIETLSFAVGFKQL
jgi:hypothetical protein